MEWAQKWQMNFTINQGKVLHIVHKNKKASLYCMSSVEQQNITHGKGLGVIISGELNPSKQCTVAVKWPNKICEFIGKAFKFKSGKLSSLFTIHWCIPILNTVFSFGHLT